MRFIFAPLRHACARAVFAAHDGISAASGGASFIAFVLASFARVVPVGERWRNRPHAVCAAGHDFQGGIFLRRIDGDA